MAFRYSCGHCRVSSIGRVKGVVVNQVDELNWYPFCLLRCDNCGQASLLTFFVNAGWEYHLKGFHKDEVVLGFEDLHEVRIWPEKSTNVPSYLPPILADVYEDAEDNYLSGRNRAAAQLYLQALEFGCILIGAKGDERNAELNSTIKTDITSRINALFEAGSIPSGLKEWAHQIRVIGQYHKHRYVEASQDDADDLRSFTEMFLRYAFSIPGQIEARRERMKDHS